MLRYCLLHGIGLQLKAYRKVIYASAMLPIFYFLISIFVPKSILLGVPGDHFGGIFWWLWLNRDSKYNDFLGFQNYTNYPLGELNNSYLFISTFFERFTGLFLTRVLNENVAFNLLLILSFLTIFWSMLIACSIIRIDINKSLIVAFSFVCSNTVITYGLTNFNYLYLMIGIPAYLQIAKNLEAQAFRKILFPTLIIGILSYIDGYGTLTIYIYLTSLVAIIAMNFNRLKVINYIKILLIIAIINLPQLILFYVHGGVSDLPNRLTNEGDKYSLKFFSVLSKNGLDNKLEGNFEYYGVFIGYTTLLILVLVLFLLIYVIKSRKLDKIVIYLLVLLFITVLVSLGPTFVIFDHKYTNMLVNFFPLSSHMRVYSRLQIIIVFTLFLIFYRLITSIKLKSQLNYAILILVLGSTVLEILNKTSMEFYYHTSKIPGAYRWLSAQEGDFVVADLLQKTPDNYFLRYQSTHEKRMLNSIYSSNLHLSNGLGVYDDNTGCVLSNAGAKYAIWHGTKNQLQELQSANDMILVKKFPAQVNNLNAYHEISSIDDGSSAIFKIGENKKKLNYLVNFTNGFESPTLSNNVGIWSNSLRSTIEFLNINVMDNPIATHKFETTIYSLNENYLTVSQNNRKIWEGKINSMGTRVKIEVDLDSKLLFQISHLISPRELNIGSTDKRKLGIFITDYTDSICK